MMEPVAEIPRKAFRGRMGARFFTLIVIAIVSIAYLNSGLKPEAKSDFLRGAVRERGKRTATVEKPLKYRGPTVNIAPKKARLAEVPIEDLEEDDDDDDDYDMDEYDYDEDEDEEDDDDEEDYDLDEVDLTPVKFFDVDGDRLTFKIGSRGQLCEYVNGECEVKTVRELAYDAATGTVTDESGSFVIPELHRRKVATELKRLARFALPKVKLTGFPAAMGLKRKVSIMDHKAMEKAIENENVRIQNATKALSGMETLLGKWTQQLEEETKESEKAALPTWEKMHLESSIKRRRRDIEHLERDIQAMKKARSYMEETVVLFKADLNESLSGPVVPETPPCRQVSPSASAPGEWGFNPLETGKIERSETPSSYVVSVSTPGMTSEDVKVSVKGTTLIIKGAIEQLLEGGSCLQQLHREFDLPMNADASQLTASFVEGKLVVEIAKLNAAPKDQEKDIPVKINKKK